MDDNFDDIDDATQLVASGLELWHSAQGNPDNHKSKRGSNVFVLVAHNPFIG